MRRGQVSLLVAGLVSLAVLEACAPVTPENAARECEERARRAAGPTGTIYAGVSTNGPVVGGDISISTEMLSGRDPYEVYESCVWELSGQAPIRSLDLRR